MTSPGESAARAMTRRRDDLRAATRDRTCPQASERTPEWGRWTRPAERGRLLGDAIVHVERPSRVKRTCGIAGATVHAPVDASEWIASRSSSTRSRPAWTEFTLHVPRRVAIRVGGGVADTDVDGVGRTGLAAGTVLASTTTPRPVRRRRDRSGLDA